MDAKLINPLARHGAKSGMIKFIHKDGKEHAFYTCVNDLSGSRLSWFDNNAPDVDESLAYIKSVFKDIRKKAKVIQEMGDF